MSSVPILAERAPCGTLVGSAVMPWFFLDRNGAHGKTSSNASMNLDHIRLGVDEEISTAQLVSRHLLFPADTAQ